MKFYCRPKAQEKQHLGKSHFYCRRFFPANTGVRIRELLSERILVISAPPIQGGLRRTQGDVTEDSSRSQVPRNRKKRRAADTPASQRANLLPSPKTSLASSSHLFLDRNSAIAFDQYCSPPCSWVSGSPLPPMCSLSYENGATCLCQAANTDLIDVSINLLDVLLSMLLACFLWSMNITLIDAFDIGAN